MPTTAEKKPPRQKALDIYNPTYVLFFYPFSPNTKCSVLRLRSANSYFGYLNRSTGHQVGSGVSKPTSWHRSRSSKLQHQFRNNPLLLPTPGDDTPSEAKGESGGATALITTPCSTRKESHEHASSAVAEITQTGTSRPSFQHGPTNRPTLACTPNLDTSTHSVQTPTSTGVTKIFARCTIYINGTTSPAISDHVLKRHLCTHGASIATMLLRKSVTHVILGKPSSAGGSGGGLAAGKLQKELTKGGRPIKFVSVQW